MLCGMPLEVVLLKIVFPLESLKNKFPDFEMGHSGILSSTLVPVAIPFSSVISITLTDVLVS